MRHLRSIAGAVALALCAYACTPSVRQPCPTPPDTVEPDSYERFGATSMVSSTELDLESNADTTSAVVTGTGLYLRCLQIIMASGGTPVGVFKLQGSYEGATYFDIYLDANKVYGANFASFTGGTSVSVDSPGGVVVIGACVEHPPPFVRSFYDRASGGAVDAIDLYWFGRTS